MVNKHLVKLRMEIAYLKEIQKLTYRASALGHTEFKALWVVSGDRTMEVHY